LQAKRVLVCADDFGMHAAADAAIIELGARGRLGAAGCLVDGPSFVEGASGLSVSRLQCGLHLNFTEDLGAGGLFMPLGALMRACWMRRLDPSAVSHQICRQLDRYEDVMGRAPDYVDGHQHVHQFPQIREALLRELDGRYLAASGRPWLRSTVMGGQAGLPVGVRMKAAAITLLGGRHHRRLLHRHGYSSNRAFLGVYGFQGGRIGYAALLRPWLSAARDGDLIMCHPAVQAVPGDALGAQRLAEFEAWKSDETGEWLQQYGVTPAPADYPRISSATGTHAI